MMRKLLVVVSFALLGLVGAAGCRATDAAETGREPPRDLVLADGDCISGTVTVRSLEIPPGVTVHVDDDLDVHATGRVYIEGKLIAADRDPDDEKNDAPTIELETRGSLLITGEILGGHGRNNDHLPVPEGGGMPGGKGTSITISAGRFSILGVIRAGKGGSAGWGGKGGSGGDIYILGRSVNPWEIRGGATVHPERGIYGGAAGRGGQAHRSVNSGTGGAGGDSGGAIFEERETSIR